MVRSTAEASTGMTLTSRPVAQAIVFPLTSPSAPPNGSFWVEDDGVTVKLCVKRLDGSLITFEVG